MNIGTHQARNSRTDKRSGFTLIEIAIIMVIVGFLIAGFFSFMGMLMAKKRVELTRENIAQVQRALSAHMDEFGDLPCPASLTAGPGDPGYGWEAGAGPADDVTDCDDMVTATDTGGPVGADTIDENDDASYSQIHRKMENRLDMIPFQ